MNIEANVDLGELMDSDWGGNTCSQVSTYSFPFGLEYNSLPMLLKGISQLEIMRNGSCQLVDGL